MKMSGLTAAVVIVAFVLGFSGGYGFRWLTGYHYRLLSSTEHGSGEAIATEKHFSESIGMEIVLDTGSSSIEWRTDGLPVTIYKARRAFQEDYPIVRDVRVDGNGVTWADGMNKYSLKIEAMKRKRESESEPAPPANPRPGSVR